MSSNHSNESGRGGRSEAGVARPATRALAVLGVTLGLVACGSDDDAGDAAPVDEVVGDAAAGEAGDDSGDAGSGDATEPPESGGEEAGSADERGLVTIDGVVYEYDVEWCEGAVDQLIRIAGPGTTPDGEPFWVETRWGLGGPVTSQLGVGVTEPSATAEGDPMWQLRADDGAQFVDFGEDLVVIEFESPVQTFSDPSAPEIVGSVSAACRLG